MVSEETSGETSGTSENSGPWRCLGCRGVWAKDIPRCPYCGRTRTNHDNCGVESVLALSSVEIDQGYSPET